MNCDKSIYKSEKAARAVARSCQRKRNTRLRWYFCRSCIGWHLSSSVID